MGAKYDKLFTIIIGHEFFNKSYLSIDLVPTVETVVLLQGLKALYSLNQNVFTVVIPTVEAKPQTALSPACFRFYISIKDTRFNNVTGGVQALGQKVLYFSNYQSRVVGTENYLSAPIAKYNKDINYEHGDLAANATGAIYEALLTNKAGATSKALTNATYWRKLDAAKTYVSTADQVDKGAEALTLKFEPAVASASVAIKKFNPVTKLLDVDAVAVQNFTFPIPVAELSTDLNALPSARYNIVSGTQNVLVYKDNDLLKNGYQGIVEVYHDPQLPETGKLIAGDGTLKKPVFSVLFRLRSVLWRYITKTPDDVTSLVDASDNSIVFNKELDKSFLSTKLLEVQEKSTRNIVLKKGSLVKAVTLQSPVYQTFKRIKKDDNTFLVSEAFINF